MKLFKLQRATILMPLLLPDVSGCSGTVSDGDRWLGCGTRRPTAASGSAGVPSVRVPRGAGGKASAHRRALGRSAEVVSDIPFHQVLLRFADV